MELSPHARTRVEEWIAEASSWARLEPRPSRVGEEASWGNAPLQMACRPQQGGSFNLIYFRAWTSIDELGLIGTGIGRDSSFSGLEQYFELLEDHIFFCLSDPSLVQSSYWSRAHHIPNMVIPSTANGRTNGNVPTTREPEAYDVCVVGAGPAGLMLRYVT